MYPSRFLPEFHAGSLPKILPKFFQCSSRNVSQGFWDSFLLVCLGIFAEVLPGISSKEFSDISPGFPRGISLAAFPGIRGFQRSFLKSFNISSWVYSLNFIPLLHSGFFSEVPHKTSPKICAEFFENFHQDSFRHLLQFLTRNHEDYPRRQFEKNTLNNSCKNCESNYYRNPKNSIQNHGNISGRETGKSSGNNPEKICKTIISGRSSQEIL